MNQTHPILPYVPHLRRYARALIGNDSAADDLVQDTLERALKKFDLWQPGTNLRAWLFSVMHNVYVNQVRSSRNWESLDDNMEIPVGPNQDHGLHIRDLDNALQELPLDQRKVLLLVSLEGMRYEEVSAALGVPMGTVMSRLSRGRERLRCLMDGCKKRTNMKVTL